MGRDRSRFGTAVLLRLAPGAVFLVLVVLTAAVWRQQAGHEQSLLRRHTEDVCFQGARRLEVFVEARLQVAALFARRWESHETRDFSRRRFEEFASLLVAEVPGYARLRLVPTDLSPGWEVPSRGPGGPGPLTGEERRVLDLSRSTGEVTLSAPFDDAAGDAAFSAALPLRRDGTPLGIFLVEFLVSDLVDDCFHERIRAEFDFTVRDGDRLIYRYPPGGEGRLVEEAVVHARRAFAVRNRVWRLTVAPRSRPPLYGWAANLTLPLFGLALSLVVGLLTGLLTRRMELYRAARDRALGEVAEREKAQAALVASEARYRGVFDSATNGLLIVDRAGIIVEANRVAGEMHGRQPAELSGATVNVLFGLDGRRLRSDIIRRAAEQEPFLLETVNVRGDGTLFDAELRGTGIRFGAGPHLLLIVNDVSERKRSEERHRLLSRKVLLAQEDERARVSRELHDELGQVLTALRLELGWLQRGAGEGRAEREGALANAVELVENAATTLRRICRGLRPPLLDDLGLEPAVRMFAEEFSGFTGLSVDLEIDLEGEGAGLPPEVTLCAYRILQESLNNIQRHAGPCEVSVALDADAQRLMLSVYDSGRGFDAGKPNNDRCCGLEGMRERTGLVGGTLEICSVPGQGTRVQFIVPLARNNTGEKP